MVVLTMREALATPSGDGCVERAVVGLVGPFPDEDAALAWVEENAFTDALHFDLDCVEPPTDVAARFAGA